MNRRYPYGTGREENHDGTCQENQIASRRPPRDRPQAQGRRRRLRAHPSAGVRPRPGLRARGAAPVEHPGFTRIVRAGIAYYAKPDFKILNPFKEGGNGVYFVKGCNDDPTGIFFTDAYRVNDAEYGDAIEAYLFAYGIPRDDLAMVPVTFWPRTYERTPENIAALRAVGAPLPNEGL